MGLQTKFYKVVTLDSRYTGNQYFKYMIDCRGSQKEVLMFEFRNWFWTNYGASAEFRSWVVLTGRNVIFQSKNIAEPHEISPVWAWESEYNRARIYVKDDETLSNFILQH